MDLKLPSEDLVHQTWRPACSHRFSGETGRVIEERDGFKLNGCFIDGTFAKARGGDGIGATKLGKGLNIVLLVDARGLPISVETMAAGPHESKAVRQLFEFTLTSQTSPHGIYDKAHDSDALDAALAERGVELIAPQRKSRKPQNLTQNRPPPQRYKRRWTVERTIAGVQHSAACVFARRNPPRSIRESCTSAARSRSSKRFWDRRYGIGDSESIRGRARRPVARELSLRRPRFSATPPAAPSQRRCPSPGSAGRIQETRTLGAATR